MFRPMREYLDDLGAKGQPIFVMTRDGREFAAALVDVVWPPTSGDEEVCAAVARHFPDWASWRAGYRGVFRGLER